MLKSKTSCLDCHNSDCLIKRSCLESDIKIIEQNKVSFKIRKKQPIFQEDNESHNIYFVYSGIVKVFKFGAFNKDQIVRFSVGGNILGHRGFIPQNVFPISAQAITEVQVCSFAKEYFFKLLEQTPLLSTNLVLIFAKELYHEETKLRDMAIFNVREKVAKALLLLIEKFGLNNDSEILDVETLSRQDIAEYIGLTSNQITKVLSEFKNDNLIETNGKRIKVLSKEKLEAIVSFLT
jgi:CRP-like cAMP-binding protein